MTPTQISGSPWQGSWNSGASPVLAPTATTFAVSTGDLLVVHAQDQNNNAFGTPTNAAGTSPASITWTLRQNQHVASHTEASAWTGAVTAGGNVQVSLTSTQNFGLMVWGFSSHGGVGQSASGNGTASAPSVSPPSAWSPHSAITCGAGDWNAATIATRTYLTNTGTATEDLYTPLANYTVLMWHYVDSGTAPGSGAVGLTTSLQWTLTAVEVLDVGGGALPPGPRRFPLGV